MSFHLRRLNKEGFLRFSNYIDAGCVGPAPIELLQSPETSEPVGATIDISVGNFSDRMELGNYLNDILSPLDTGEISTDRGLWSALALLWFDLVCPLSPNGSRRPDKAYRYILSQDYRHYYRHCIRTPWQLVRDHGENARFLLTSPRAQDFPLSVHGEILEQFGGRQGVLSNRAVIEEANSLYLDPQTLRPKRGCAGSSAGSARRFALVLRQLDLTFDAACMPNGALQGILPREFDRWKSAL